MVNKGFPGTGSGIESGIFLRRAGPSLTDHEVMENSTDTETQRRLRRSTDGRLLAGVGAGVADYLGTDVTATRVGLAATAVLAHVAIPAYAVAWALIPEEGKSRPRAAEFMDSAADRVDSLISRARQSRAAHA